VGKELINMLVLSRKPGERIRIANDIWITVIGERRGKVRLGIEAPDDVEIAREELIDDDGSMSRPGLSG
jgi:carbon storage regulator